MNNQKKWNFFHLSKGCILGSLKAAAFSAIAFSGSINAAVNENVTLGELIDFLDKEDKSDIEYYAAVKLKEKLEKKERVLLDNGEYIEEDKFVFENGQYIDSTEYSDTNFYHVPGTCAKVQLLDMTSSTIIDRKTNLKLQASAIDKPIVLTSSAKAKILIEGRVRLKFGVRTPFGGCVKYGIASATKNIRGTTDANANLKAVININPSKQPLNIFKVRYKIEPTLSLTGEVTHVGMPKFNVVHGGVAGSIINKINDIGLDLIERDTWNSPLSLISLTAREGADYLGQESIENQQKALTRDLAESVLGDNVSTWSYGDPIVKYIDLPVYTEEAFKAVAGAIKGYESHFPITKEFIKNANTQQELYMAILNGDTNKISETLANGLACQLSSNLTVNMSRHPSSDYIDIETHAEFCATQVGENSKNLGNAAGLPTAGSDWTITPGTSFDLGVKSIKGNSQPYMKRIPYKSVQSKSTGQQTVGEVCATNSQGVIQMCTTQYEQTYRGNGTCKLEMRVYKKDTKATGLKPLMAFHGGSYKYRGFGFFGLESQISHFTDRGFAVFAPFYRLVGNSDGNVECNGVNGKDIISDAKDALAWVEKNAKNYGATGKVKMFGQSAGAHLAAYLAAHKKESVDRAWLMYPPLDYGEYLYNWSPTRDPLGTSAVEGFLSSLTFDSLANLQFSSDPFILENSLTDIFAEAPNSFPRLFMMHGLKDDLVPANQSKKMCEALGGSGTFSGGNPSSGSYKREYTCGNSDNKMHLFSQGQHIMDIACVDDSAGIDKLCLSGSRETANAIEDSYNDALAWLTNTAIITPIPSGSACEWKLSTSSGGQGFTVKTYRSVGPCTDSIRNVYTEGNRTRTVYR